MNRVLLAVVFILGIPTLSSAQDVTPDCVGAGCGQSVPAACVPDCREGYMCEAGACVASPSTCVPDCRAGFACEAGTCVSTQPLATAAPVQPVQAQPVQHAVPVTEAAPPPQSQEDDPTVVWPREFSMRPLTLPKGVLASSVGFSVSALRSDLYDTLYFSSFGAAVHLGIIDALQVSIYPIQLGLSPDFEAFDPSIAIRAAFVRTKVFQMGASYGLRLPLTEDSSGMVNTLQLDFLVRTKIFRFQAAIFAGFQSYDDGSDEEGGGSSVAITSGLSTSFGFQLAPIFALNFDLSHSILDGDSETYGMTFAPNFIFNIPRSDGTPLMDIAAGISLPEIIAAGRTDTFDARIVTGSLSVAFYNDLY